MNASEVATGHAATGAGALEHDGLIVRGVAKTFNQNVVLDLAPSTQSGLKKADCDFWDGLPL